MNDSLDGVLPFKSSELQALEDFVYDNPELENLEAILDDFNPFSAMGWVRQEVRHSAFQRWLLDPAETHGLGPYALRAFLKRVARKASDEPDDRPTVFDVDGCDLSEAQVLAEWKNIDIMAVDEDSRIVLVIENKIDSSEHSSQLQRYWEIVEDTYQGYKKLYVFLTIAGEPPSDDHYIAVSYEDIVALLSTLLERRKSQLSDDVAIFIEQYLEMLRRHIVEDSQVQNLCREIYQSHRRALDVLFEHRPDKTSEVAEIITALLKERNDVHYDRGSKTSIRFIPKSRDLLPRHGTGGLSSEGRILFFDIINNDSKLFVYLVVGPGETETREKLQGFVEQNAALFSRSGSKMGPTYWSCHKIDWLGKKKYEELSVEEIRDIVNNKLNDLVEKKIPPIVNALREVDFT